MLAAISAAAATTTSVCVCVFGATMKVAAFESPPTTARYLLPLAILMALVMTMAILVCVKSTVFVM